MKHLLLIISLIFAPIYVEAKEYVGLQPVGLASDKHIEHYPNKAPARIKTLTLFKDGSSLVLGGDLDVNTLVNIELYDVSSELLYSTTVNFRFGVEVLIDQEAMDNACKVVVSYSERKYEGYF